MVNNKSSKNLKWLQVDNSIISNGNSENDNNKKPAKLIKYDNKDNKGYILCKIGMTTRPDVQLRLNEWETHCHHQVVNLTPQNISLLIQRVNKSHKSSTLLQLFQKLSIKDNSNDRNKSFTMKQLTTYENGGFFVPNKTKIPLAHIESHLHRLFWNKYGRGIIRCSGCSVNGKDSKRHMEWFNVPISELPSILHTIDDFIHAQSCIK